MDDPTGSGSAEIATSSALVSNTLVCEASRLLAQSAQHLAGRQPFEDNDEDEPGIAFRLLDLFSAIEATVLYDRLCTLPARLTLSGERLELRDQLIATGVLFELDLAEDHERIAQLIVEGLAQINNPVVFERGKTRPIDYDGSVRASIETFFEANGYPNIFDGNRFSLHGGNCTEILEAQNFNQFGRHLIRWIDYFYSGSYEFCTSVLRDMYYIYAAECRQLAYWPETTRVEFARKFPNFMERGARTKLYSKFAKELGASLRQVRDVFDKSIMFIPPFSALVLDRSESIRDIPDQILKIRHEFMWLRHDMQALDTEMREADTFGKMQQVARKQKRLSDIIGEQFAKKDSVWIDRGLKYIPELVGPALSPGDPSKYGSALLLQPVEWLIDAFRRRPVAMFFDAKKKVESIHDYQSLVSRVFKTDIDGAGRLNWYFPIAG